MGDGEDLPHRRRAVHLRRTGGARGLLPAALALGAIPFASGCQFWHLLTWGLLPVDAVRAPVDVVRARGSVSESEQPGPMETALYARAAGTDGRRLIADTGAPENDPKLWARACDAGDDEACAKAAGIFVYFFHDRKYGLEVWQRLCSEGRGDPCLRLGDYWRAEEPGSGSPAHFYRAGCDAAVPSATACRRLASAALRGDREGWSPLVLTLMDRACALGDWDACDDLSSCLAGKSLCGVPIDEPLARHFRASVLALRSVAPADGPDLLLEADRLERIRVLREQPWPHSH